MLSAAYMIVQSSDSWGRVDTSFESLDLQIEHEPNSHSAPISSMDYSAKLVLALEIDLY